MTGQVGREVVGREVNDLAEDPSLEHNRQAWDRLVQAGHWSAHPIQEACFADPLGSVDRLGWLGRSIAGWRVLCLAAGGGRHGPLYAAAGATVTVMDLSPGTLELDRQAAAQRRLSLRLVQGTMTDLSMFGAAEFDLVVQPVSTCYVPDLLPVFSQVARVLRGGGLYISQHKTPQNLQASLQWDRQAAGDGAAARGGYVLQHGYYDGSAVPPVERPSALREPGTREYVHRWEQLVGGMCRAGFVVEDLMEPPHGDAQAPPGSLGHRSTFIAPYVRIKARRVGGPELVGQSSGGPVLLW